MAVLKMRDIKNMGEQDLDDKLKELRLELVKSKKDSKVRIKEIKKAIARILTIIK